jgi:hypothetical protein
MPAADIDDSPLTMTRMWEEVFGRLDQWDMVDKLRVLHLKSSTSTSSTGFLQLKSPDIAHFVANTSRRVRRFHHFHHDADDGLNDETDELLSHGRRHGGQQEPREQTPVQDDF